MATANSRVKLGHFLKGSKTGVILGVIFTSVTLLYLWLVEWALGGSSRPDGLVILFNLGLCVLYHGRYSRDSEGWGFSRAHFNKALGWSALFTIPVAAILLLAGLAWGTLNSREHPLEDLAVLFVWALAQQFALQTFLLREASNLFPAGKAVFTASALFAVFHLPNPFLFSLTFLGALVWSLIYSRHPNLLPLAISHSVISFIILSTLPRSITGGMRVGYAYFLQG